MMKRIALALVLLPAGHVPASAQAQPEGTKAPLDRNDPGATRCRKFAVTGSLVRKERVCKTNAEWRAILDQQGRDADNLIERSRAGMDCRASLGGPGGC